MRSFPSSSPPNWVLAASACLSAFSFASRSFASLRSRRFSFFVKGLFSCSEAGAVPAAPLLDAGSEPLPLPVPPTLPVELPAAGPRVALGSVGFACAPESPLPLVASAVAFSGWSPSASASLSSSSDSLSSASAPESSAGAFSPASCCGCFASAGGRCRAKAKVTGRARIAARSSDFVINTGSRPLTITSSSPAMIPLPSDHDPGSTLLTKTGFGGKPEGTKPSISTPSSAVAASCGRRILGASALAAAFGFAFAPAVAAFLVLAVAKCGPKGPASKK
mmetsp:Transcript_51385/g.143673  ORF Transcript_51385/g.143673 Transcript_51385/m.143673 type:complete len:278 (-) Transcript_51385:1045-1878(-)